MRRQPLYVCIHHHLNQLLEIYLRLPAQHVLRFGGIADQMIDLSGSKELRVGFDVFLPLEANAAERDLDQLAN